MDILQIDGLAFLKMVRQGAVRLNENRKVINDLNVFPIPDGDTGDNMYLTLSAGRDNGNRMASADLGAMAQAISEGMLLGARGNSGVILSRIFAGIAKGLIGKKAADVKVFAGAMQSGVESAYGAVSVPVEGTILTVLKDSVSAAKNVTDGKLGSDIDSAASRAVSEPNFKSSNIFEAYFSALVAEMDASLKRTPELLPVLKEAGVVDSGGAGLLCIARGMLDALQGKGDEAYEDLQPETHAGHAAPNLSLFTEDSELEFGYCTEFLLRLQRAKVGEPGEFDETQIRDWLNSVGDSVVCFKDGSIVKVHVHTKTPGEILNHCQQWGEFLTIKVENMTLQHQETTIQNNFSGSGADPESHSAPADEPLIQAQRQLYGVVTVATGPGLVQTFKEAGADAVIVGGQTMNPSAQSFVEAFKGLNAETILVFPNNSNIIMTAQQAAGLYTDSRVVVLPSKDLGAGYVAIASLDRSCKDAEEVIAAAKEAIASVQTGMVTTATRDTQMDGVSVHAGDYVGITRGEIVADDPNRAKLAQALAGKMDFANHEVAIVFSGEGVPAAEADALMQQLQAQYPRTEMMLTEGGQPVYDYIIVLC